jgi:hypothetical protein
VLLLDVAVGKSRSRKRAARLRMCTSEPPCTKPSRRTACLRRTRWPFSKPTFTGDPAGSPGVFPTATDGRRCRRRPPWGKAPAGTVGPAGRSSASRRVASVIGLDTHHSLHELWRCVRWDRGDADEQPGVEVPLPARRCAPRDEPTAQPPVLLRHRLSDVRSCRTTRSCASSSAALSCMTRRATCSGMLSATASGG